MTEKQKGWLSAMRRGCGWDASEFKGKDKKEMEELIKKGLVKKIRNYGRTYSYVSAARYPDTESG